MNKPIIPTEVRAEHDGPDMLYTGNNDTLTKRDLLVLAIVHGLVSHYGLSAGDIKGRESMVWALADQVMAAE